MKRIIQPNLPSVMVIVLAMLATVMIPDLSTAASIEDTENTADFLMYAALALVGIALIIMFVKLGDSNDDEKESTKQESEGTESESETEGLPGVDLISSNNGQNLANSPEQQKDKGLSLIPVCGFGDAGAVAGICLEF